MPENDDTQTLKQKAVALTFYVLPHDHKRLRLLAAAKDTTIQALLMNGLDRVLADGGEAPLTRWRQRRRKS